MSDSKQNIKFCLPNEVPPLRPTGQNIAAPSLRVKELEKALDMTKFLNQLESLLHQPIKIPGIPVQSNPTSSEKIKHYIFSVKNVWKSEKEHVANVSKLYNTSSIGDRDWLKRVLIEESDSESDGEIGFTKPDIHHLLKIHKKRRKLQKGYHTEALNSQYTYYAAGLLSTEDQYPEHRKNMERQFGFPT
uniref:Uncharacterized protein n=1 Tax=Rhabditophanes sp. KR3021 TaxID=114890 RepID=A0AC35TPN8_9BILA